MKKHATAAVGGIVTLLSLASTAAGQAPTAADSALEACSAAAEGEREAEAKAAADRAEGLYRAALRARPADADARVGLARVISQCRIPFANVMSAGRLIGESNQLLADALERDPAHWTARFVLGMNHYHTPAFLGKGSDAVREFETLLRQQGDRADRPNFALPYVYLGDLYKRGGRRAEAAALWRRGAALFPNNALLRQRLAEETAAAAPVAPVQGEALTVRARRPATQATQGLVTLNRLEVITAPGGAADLLQGIRMQGGATQANDGSDLFVRGGEPAESPAWMDGGRMFYAGSFETLHGGLFGVLDPAVLREARFSTGGFSARYGNALSGVLDVQTAGRPEAARGSIGASVAGASGNGWLPLGQKAGVWATGRLTDAALLIEMQGKGDEFSESPRAVQLTTGVTVEPRRGVEVKATILVQGDGATRDIESNGHEGPFRSRGQTLHGVLSSRLVRDDGAQLRASVALSQRSTAFRFGVLDRERTDRAASAALAGDLPLAEATVLRAGLEATALEAEEEGTMPETGSVAPGSAVTQAGSDAGASHLGGFLEVETDPLPGLSLVAGLRADRLPGESTWTADPRLSLAYRFAGWTMRVGGGVFQQGRWRTGYTIPDAGAPSGLPRRARHLTAGLEQQGEGKVRVEAYLKEYDRYVPNGDGPRIVAGRVLGLDSRVRWTVGDRLSGWVAYSFLRGRVELEDGATLPSRVDVTHGLTGVGKLAIGKAWELGATARYATGRPYTPVVGALDGDPVYGAINGARVPDYRRLDTRLTRFGQIGNRQVVTYLELLNALDRPNVMGYTYDSTYRERRPIESFFASRVAVLGLEVQL